MYLHAFGTGGSIDSLATRCPLTFQPKYVDGVVFAFILVASPDQVLIMGSYNVSIPSVAGGSASSVYLLNNFTLASSIFVRFSTRYNKMNSSAS